MALGFSPGKLLLKQYKYLLVFSFFTRNEISSKKWR